MNLSLTRRAAAECTGTALLVRGDACPVFPGKRYEDWQLTDPAGQPLDVVRQVRDDIRARVETLVSDLRLQPER